MANIQPFDYQESTNIEEHNQIVNKVNEIVQVINDVNLDTINSEIANLKANATATDTEIANIKNKDSAQDTEINGITKRLVSNVTATFDNPSRELKISLGREASPSIDATVVIPSSSETGQYSAGNGITIDNYQIAVDTEVVALKTDIPIVPDISQLTADVEQNKRDIQTINTEITGITNDITNVNNKNTEQDTAIAGKVAISQGVENAGKVLGIGPDGNVTPIDGGGSSGGGEVWEEVNLSNWPTDWQIGDRIKVMFNVATISSSPYVYYNQWTNPAIEIAITSTGSAWNSGAILYFTGSNSWVRLSRAHTESFNSSNDGVLFDLEGCNGGSTGTFNLTKSQLSTYIYKMWRYRASS